MYYSSLLVRVCNFEKKSIYQPILISIGNFKIGKYETRKEIRIFVLELYELSSNSGLCFVKSKIPISNSQFENGKLDTYFELKFVYIQYTYAYN